MQWVTRADGSHFAARAPSIDNLEEDFAESKGLPSSRQGRLEEAWRLVEPWIKIAIAEPGGGGDARVPARLGLNPREHAHRVDESPI